MQSKTNKPRISCITVTNRYGSIDVTYNTLKRQTFSDWEWVLHDSLYEERKDAVAAFTKNDPRVKHSQQEPKDPKAKTWLAHAENGAIKQASGELIVFLQDFIAIKPDALEKFWIQYQVNPKCFVTGVGNQYGSPGKDDIVDPKGLITVFDEPFTGLPCFEVWRDPRMRSDIQSFYPCNFNDIEFNFCAIPKKALYDIGGLDEHMDYLGFAWDNVHASGRMQMLGYEPYIDQSNQSFSINSDAWSKSPAKTLENSFAVAEYCNNSLKKMVQGQLPIKLRFLDK